LLGRTQLALGNLWRARACACEPRADGAVTLESACCSHWTPSCGLDGEPEEEGRAEAGVSREHSVRWAAKYASKILPGKRAHSRERSCATAHACTSQHPQRGGAPTRVPPPEGRRRQRQERNTFTWGGAGSGAHHAKRS
jgi:hypothetical protein